MMQIALHDAADALERVKTWRASCEHGVGIRDPNPIDSQLAYFLNAVVPQDQVRVVKHDGTIVAFLAAAPDSVSQLDVGVHNIGQGMGSRWIGIAKSESRGR